MVPQQLGPTTDTMRERILHPHKPFVASCDGTAVTSCIHMMNGHSTTEHTVRIHVKMDNVLRITYLQGVTTPMD